MGGSTSFTTNTLLQAVETETFIKESEARIAKLQAELAEWEKMIPYEQMTMEEMVEAFPEKVSSSHHRLDFHFSIL